MVGGLFPDTSLIFLSLTTLQKRNSFSWKECAISVALSVGLISGAPTLGSSAYASPLEPILPDVSVLISGPPVKDPGALLRYALPINNKAIREVQKPLEDITDSLKVAGVRALDSVERVSHAFKDPFSTDLGFIRQKGNAFNYESSFPSIPSLVTLVYLFFWNL